MGGYGLRISIRFDIKNWPPSGSFPSVTLGHAVVAMRTRIESILGVAFPEALCPIRVTEHAYSQGLLFDLFLTRSAMEAIEIQRNGGDVVLKLDLLAQVSLEGERESNCDQILCRVGQSDWLRALAECGYGRSLLFEIPLMPNAENVAEDAVAAELSRASAQMARGHYQEVVGICRRVMERLNAHLNEADALAQARSMRGEEKRSLNISQRELMIRAAAIDYAHYAHHADRGSDHAFDRLDATMILAVTAALVGAALQRTVREKRCGE
jgi:hypothetical protein